MGFQFSCLTQRIILDFRGQRLIGAGETKTNENHLSFSPHLKIKKENRLTKQTICFIIPLVGKLDFKKRWGSGRNPELTLRNVHPCARDWHLAVHEIDTWLRTRLTPGCAQDSYECTYSLAGTPAWLSYNCSPSSITYRSILIIDFIIFTASNCDFWNEARDGYRIQHSIFVLNTEGKGRMKRKKK